MHRRKAAIPVLPEQLVLPQPRCSGPGLRSRETAQNLLVAAVTLIRVGRVLLGWCVLHNCDRPQCRNLRLNQVRQLELACRGLIEQLLLARSNVVVRRCSPGLRVVGESAPGRNVHVLLP